MVLLAGKAPALPLLLLPVAGAFHLVPSPKAHLEPSHHSTRESSVHHPERLLTKNCYTPSVHSYF